MAPRRTARPTLAMLAAEMDGLPPARLPALIRRLERDPRPGARRLAERARRRWRQWEEACRRWEDMAGVERRLRAGGARRVAGIDEVGRGCLAGPVVAAAVILPESAFVPGLDDSKRLTPAQREELAAEIRRQAEAWAVGVATPAEIDALNIWHATRLAMRRALDGLPVAPDVVLVDGRPVPDLGVPQEAVVDGDARCNCIAAASVLAKVFRDRWMAVLDAAYPGYGFGEHKGYATAAHREALRLRGPCPEHRFSFLPVRTAARGEGQRAG